MDWREIGEEFAEAVLCFEMGVNDFYEQDEFEVLDCKKIGFFTSSCVWSSILNTIIDEARKSDEDWDKVE